MAEPFTLDHFRDWASSLLLDSEEPWILEPFQEAFLADVFAGAPECWLVVPEGNGKTTLVAGLILYHSLFRREASIPVAASARDQAEWTYRQAAGFVGRSDLQSTFTCLEGYRRIRCDSLGSRIQIFAADARTGDGIIPTLAVLDELHRHQDLALYRTWSGKLWKRHGQLVIISTAGEPGGEFEETRERIRQSASEIERDGSFLRARAGRIVLHEWAVPEAGDIEDFACVKSANPFSGITEDALREKYYSPAMTQQHWRRFTCNLPTRSARAAVMEAEWDAAKTDREIPVGEPIGVGLDVAWKWDTTAIVPFWSSDPEFRLLGPSRILTPPRDGTSLDPALVEAALTEMHRQNPIHTVVMDTTKAEQLADWIASEIGATVIDRAQGNANQAEDYAAFMEALRMGWLKHTGDPGLRRHVLNAIARLLPDGKARFDREKASRSADSQDSRVIDALTAAAMVNCELGAGVAGVWAGNW